MTRLGIDEEQVETISVDSEPEEEESNYRRLVHQLDSIHIMFLQIPILFSRYRALYNFAFRCF
jgi:hypothetical protein